MTGTERIKRRRTTLRRMLVTRYLWMFLAVAASIAGASALTEEGAFSASVDAVALTDKILYRVDHSDLSAVASPPSMQIELTSQYGSQNIPLHCDSLEGVFEGLYPNVLYRLSVQVDTTFGWVEKAFIEVRTKQGPSAGFSVLFPLYDSLHGEELILPTFQTYYDDPDQEYAAWRLRWQLFSHEEDWALPSAEAGYETVLLNASQARIETIPIYPFNQYLSVFLEGQTDAGVWVIFEHRIVKTPLAFESSVYVSSWLPDKLGFYAFVMDPLDVGAVFAVELWKSGERIASIEGLKPDVENSESSSSMLWFEHLTRQTEYQLKLTVDYVDPDTGFRHHRVLEESTVTTPDRYNVSTHARIEGSQVILDIELWDPDHLLSDFQYNVYHQEMQEYLFGSIPLVDQGGGNYTATVAIDFTQSGPKTISITAVLQIDSETNVTTSLYHDIVE